MPVFVLEKAQIPVPVFLAYHSAVLPQIEPAGDIKSLLSQYEWNVEIAHLVILAESGGKNTAHNPEWHSGCQGSFGLFQIGCVNYSGDLNDLYIPRINIEMAYQIYKTQGIRAWGVCKNGSVNCTDW